MPITEEIAAFAANFSLKTAPAELLPLAKETFLDSFGVMLAGSTEESAQITARWACAEGAIGPCALSAERGFRTSAANAALANGVAAHTLDFDHFGHQSAVMVPCVLAAAEAQGASGLALIEAYIVGVEISTLLAAGMSKTAQELGLHPAGVCGSLGASAAAARLLGLGLEQTQVALGIAASLTSGLSQNFGTMVKPLHIANAARNGIVAAELASLGFTANTSIFDQHGGFFSALAPANVANLGKKFRFLEPGIAFKAYPCPYSSQRAVDAIIRIAERHHLRPENIVEIVCAAAPKTFRVLIHHRPNTSLEAKFSLEYLLAAGLTRKTIDEECFGLKHVNDPVMRNLVAKVSIIESADQRGTPGEGPVTVRVRTDNEIYEETVSYAPGHPKNPLSWERLVSKYRSCARQGGFDDTMAADCLAKLSRLDEVADAREVTRLFAS
jgi:aconitate decarboxylase